MNKFFLVMYIFLHSIPIFSMQTTTTEQPTISVNSEYDKIVAHLKSANRFAWFSFGGNMMLICWGFYNILQGNSADIFKIMLGLGNAGLILCALEHIKKTKKRLSLDPSIANEV